MADDDLFNSPTKFNRSYTEAELALFAEYAAERQAERPSECTYADVCWVIQGPPGMTSRDGAIRCRGCGAALGTAYRRPRRA
jgi:hypothetical protein